MKETVTTVARVNQVDIQIIQNGEKRVAVKPICEALGIAFEPQYTRLKTDPILSSVVTMNVTTGSDGKQYEMITIPLEFVFGWLFMIDSRNVKPEARESVLRYQKECYHALYNYFTRKEAYLVYRQERMEKSFEKQQQARINFNQAKVVLSEAAEEFRHWMGYTEDDYASDTAQLQMQFEEGGVYAE